MICLGNLRGIRESGTIFAGPAYIYLGRSPGCWGTAMFRYATGTLPAYQRAGRLGAADGTEALGLFLILRAFSSGSVALTGRGGLQRRAGVQARPRREARTACCC